MEYRLQAAVLRMAETGMARTTPCGLLFARTTWVSGPSNNRRGRRANNLAGMCRILCRLVFSANFGSSWRDPTRPAVLIRGFERRRLYRPDRGGAGFVRPISHPNGAEFCRVGSEVRPPRTPPAGCQPRLAWRGSSQAQAEVTHGAVRFWVTWMCPGHSAAASPRAERGRPPLSLPQVLHLAGQFGRLIPRHRRSPRG